MTRKLQHHIVIIFVKRMCYISDNTAYYFYDFNKVLIGNLIDWYKRVFDNFE